VTQLAPRYIANRGDCRGDRVGVRQARRELCLEAVPGGQQRQRRANPGSGIDQGQQLRINAGALVAQEAIDGLIESFGRGTGRQGQLF
jgi:hypothetical protein